MFYKKIPFFYLAIFCAFACSRKTAPNDAARKAALWLTTGDGLMRLAPTAQLAFTRTADLTLPLIEIDEKTTYQPIAGFGASMTGSSAQVLTRNPGETKRREVMQNLFSREKGLFGGVARVGSRKMTVFS